MAELFYDFWWLIFPMAGLSIGFIEMVGADARVGERARRRLESK